MTKETQKKNISEKREGDGAGDEEKVVSKTLEREVSKMPFLMLGLDLPPPPLFKDVMEKNIIPQVCLTLQSCLSWKPRNVSRRSLHIRLVMDLRVAIMKDEKQGIAGAFSTI